MLAALRLSFGAAVARRRDQCAARPAHRLGAGALPLSRPAPADALVDLPFALPTAVAGIALTALYAPNGWIGACSPPLGIKIAYTPLGIFMALIFVGLPFVVRTVQPVLMDLAGDVEEAAATLGATRLQTFRPVILPALAPGAAHRLRRWPSPARSASTAR